MIVYVGDASGSGSIGSVYIRLAVRLDLGRLQPCQRR